ncbi:hypothetical protein PUN28_004273 [Cardiocondyla obscurior]|uniref:Uncharacterized protein n=1 Tax=Cardiocondyla obscurior TaxID=286306 RepID=A0AAW2GCQ8_9HYME
MSFTNVGFLFFKITYSLFTSDLALVELFTISFFPLDYILIYTFINFFFKFTLVRKIAHVYTLAPLNRKSLFEV